MLDDDVIAVINILSGTDDFSISGGVDGIILLAPKSMPEGSSGAA